MVVEFFEVVVGGCRWLWMVLGGFRSFHVLVTTITTDIIFSKKVSMNWIMPFFKMEMISLTLVLH